MKKARFHPRPSSSRHIDADELISSTVSAQVKKGLRRQTLTTGPNGSSHERPCSIWETDLDASRFPPSWLWNGGSSQTYEGSAMALRVMKYMHSVEVSHLFYNQMRLDVDDQPLY